MGTFSDSLSAYMKYSFLCTDLKAATESGSLSDSNTGNSCFPPKDSLESKPANFFNDSREEASSSCCGERVTTEGTAVLLEYIFPELIRVEVGVCGALSPAGVEWPVDDAQYPEPANAFPTGGVVAWVSASPELAFVFTVT